MGLLRDGFTTSAKPTGSLWVSEQGLYSLPVIRFSVTRLPNSKTGSSPLAKALLSALMLKVWVLEHRQTCFHSLALFISVLHSSAAKYRTLTLPMLNWYKFSCLSYLSSILMSAAYFWSSQKLAYNLLQGTNRSSSCLKKCLWSSPI